MKAKKYEFQRGTENLLTINIGDAKNKKLKSFRFAGGTTTPRKKKPFYITADKEEQDGIERSPQYKKGLIKLASVEDVRQSVDPEGNVTTKDSEKKLKDVPGITKVQEAREYLINTYDVKAGDITNKETVLDKAYELGLSFPELK